MKKKQIRKRLRHVEDCMEEMERKMRCLDSTLFFVSLGMEYFYGQKDHYEIGIVGTVRECIAKLRTDDIAELHKTLDELREV